MKAWTTQVLGPFGPNISITHPGMLSRQTIISKLWIDCHICIQYADLHNGRHLVHPFAFIVVKNSALWMAWHLAGIPANKEAFFLDELQEANGTGTLIALGHIAPPCVDSFPITAHCLPRAFTKPSWKQLSTGTKSKLKKKKSKMLGRYH